MSDPVGDKKPIGFLDASASMNLPINFTETTAWPLLRIHALAALVHPCTSFDKIVRNNFGRPNGPVRRYGAEGRGSMMRWTGIPAKHSASGFSSNRPVLDVQITTYMGISNILPPHTPQYNFANYLLA
ncbi:hypothetical protein TDB9533_03007 [Thalassocella blandensis]|nr:hypothetical protein TDB9533_03007 [Thalassocella blandensis]